AGAERREILPAVQALYLQGRIALREVSAGDGQGALRAEAADLDGEGQLDVDGSAGRHGQLALQQVGEAERTVAVGAGGRQGKLRVQLGRPMLDARPQEAEVQVGVHVGGAGADLRAEAVGGDAEEKRLVRVEAEAEGEIEDGRDVDER